MARVTVFGSRCLVHPLQAKGHPLQFGQAACLPYKSAGIPNYQSFVPCATLTIPQIFSLVIVPDKPWSARYSAVQKSGSGKKYIAASDYPVFCGSLQLIRLGIRASVQL